MKDDKPLLVFLFGIISTIPFEIITRINMYSGFGAYSLYQLDSFVITITRPNTIIGLVVSSLVGGTSAVLFYISLSKIGDNHIVIKSILFNALIWSILEFVLTAYLEAKYFPLRPMGDYWGELFGAAAFGASVGLLFKRYILRKPAF